jgi:hypothetical protein
MITIIYRAYPKISKKTAIQFKSKDEMIDFCLKSLKKALENYEYEFIFINDDCSAQQINIVEKIFSIDAKYYKRINLAGVGNQKSFLIQIEEVRKAIYDKILILEDDYYIDEEDINLNIEALNLVEVDYSTFYFPADADFSSGKMIKDEIIINTESRRTYQSLPSTTLTFFGKKNIIIQDLEYFKKFYFGAHDSSLWLRLTGSFLWFLPKIFRPLFRKNIKLYLSIIKRYILFMINLQRKKRVLIFSGTGKTTHLDSEGVNNKFNLIYSIEKILYKYRKNV